MGVFFFYIKIANAFTVSIYSGKKEIIQVRAVVGSCLCAVIICLLISQVRGRWVFWSHRPCQLKSTVYTAASSFVLIHARTQHDPLTPTCALCLRCFATQNGKRVTWSDVMPRYQKINRTNWQTGSVQSRETSSEKRSKINLSTSTRTRMLHILLQ